MKSGQLGGGEWLIFALLLILAIGLINGGVFDPAAVAGDGEEIEEIKLALDRNSHSQITTFPLTNKLTTLTVKIDEEPADFDLNIDTGDHKLVLNPVGYAGFSPDVPFAPFPHVQNAKNEITLRLNNEQQVTEIWLNRELFWRGSSKEITQFELSIQTYDQPIQLAIIAYAQTNR